MLSKHQQASAKLILLGTVVSLDAALTIWKGVVTNGSLSTHSRATFYLGTRIYCGNLFEPLEDDDDVDSTI